MSNSDSRIDPEIILRGMDAKNEEIVVEALADAGIKPEVVKVER